MIASYWPEKFRALYGGVWPLDYVTLDVETCGYKLKSDLIIEVGHCVVRDGVVVDRLAMFVNWERAGVPGAWLRHRLDMVEQGMQRGGKHWHAPYARVRAEGRSPAEVFGFYRDFLHTLLAKGVLFAWHDGYRFDEGMLSYAFERAGIEAPRFGDNDAMDTASIEKATQLVGDVRVQPQQDDTLRSYFRRVAYAHAQGVYSNLDNHCFHKYDFAGKGLRAEDMHGASADSYAVHLLMEAWRAAATAAPAVTIPAHCAPVASRVAALPQRRKGQRNR